MVNIYIALLFWAAAFFRLPLVDLRLSLAHTRRHTRTHARPQACTHAARQHAGRQEQASTHTTREPRTQHTHNTRKAGTQGTQQGTISVNTYYARFICNKTRRSPVLPCKMCCHATIKTDCPPLKDRQPAKQEQETESRHKLIFLNFGCNCNETN